jgi:hypothetical protein
MQRPLPDLCHFAAVLEGRLLACVPFAQATLHAVGGFWYHSIRCCLSNVITHPAVQKLIMTSCLAQYVQEERCSMVIEDEDAVLQYAALLVEVAYYPAV